MFEKMENMLMKVYDMLYYHPCAIVPTLAILWTVSIGTAYVSEYTSGLLNVVLMITSFIMLFVGTAVIGALNISARCDRQADNR